MQEVHIPHSKETQKTQTNKVHKAEEKQTATIVRVGLHIEQVHSELEKLSNSTNWATE